MSDDDSHGAWQAQVADLERMAAEELARYLAAHPGYDRCPTHPERPVVDASVAHRRMCAECMTARAEAYADSKRDAAWPDTYDMRYYSDHPRYDREQGGLK